MPSFAPSFSKNFGLVDWQKSAKKIYDLYRGLYIWPGIYSVFSKNAMTRKRIKWTDIDIYDNESKNENFGRICSFEKGKGFTIYCGIGKILVLKVQPESKKEMSAWDFIQGNNVCIGDSFS
jgi:methionyl-tRNA formyltransferase